MTTKKETMSKMIKEHSAQAIFSAQERNKKTICFSKSNSKNENASTQLNRDELIRKHLHLVNWIVNRFPIASIKGYEREDLVGYGIIGLIESVDRFDPARNISFESYAVSRIRGAIYDELRASDILSRGARKKVKTLSKAIADLENKLGRIPSDGEVANELSISLEDLRQVQQEAQLGVYSLDETRESGDDTMTIADTISTGATSALEDMEESELKDILAKAIDGLPEREKTVIALYHYKRLTFKEIAQIMDFSESRASQLHARAITLLKSKMI
jgi:RNA polymerase sigma factor for flagellar operon FliA